MTNIFTNTNLNLVLPAKKRIGYLCCIKRKDFTMDMLKKTVFITLLILSAFSARSQHEEEASIALQSLHEASIDQDVISVTYADDRKKEKPVPAKPAARKIEYKAKPKIYQKVTRPGERVGGKRPRKRI